MQKTINGAMLKSMIGIAREKYHAMEHRYPSRMEWINKYGYDPKQLHHLFRLKEVMYRWRNGEPFARCLISVEPDWLIDVKKGHYNLEDARRYGKGTINFMEEMYREMKTDKPANEEYYKQFDDIILEIALRSVSREIATTV